MAGSWLTVTAGLGQYLLLCGMAVLSGRGLLRLLRVRVGEQVEVGLAPVLTFVFWTLSLGVAAAFRVPIKSVTPCLWTVSALLALNGLRRPWPAPRVLAVPLLVCALPVVTMSHCFLAGITQYVSSLACDGFGYTSQADYLWQYPRGVTENLATVYHYGAMLRDARFISATLLGFLSPLHSTGDPFAVAALLQAWILFTFGCSVYLFCVADRPNVGRALLTTVFTILSGWMANQIWTNNFDNTLALVYPPAIGAVLILWDARTASKWVLLGCLVAGVLYSYPEFTPVLLGVGVLVALPRCWPERGARVAWLYGAAGAAVLAGLLWLPVAKPMIEHSLRILEAAQIYPPGSRPGDPWFAGLLKAEVQPSALWGLGGETLAKPYVAGMNALALGLTVLLLVGLLVLVWEKRWGLPLATVGLLAATAYTLLEMRYEYPSYKLLALNWWCLVAVTMAGASWVLRWIPARAPRWALATALLAGLTLVSFHATRVRAPLWPSPYHAAHTREGRALRSAVHARHIPALLICAEDWLPNLLAVHYLKDQGLHIGAPRGFLSPNAEYMKSARAAPLADVEWVLTDSNPHQCLGLLADGPPAWSCGPYRLWKPNGARSGATLCHIENQVSGIQVDGAGNPFLWVGDVDTVFYVMATRAGTLELSAKFLAGPSLPGQPTSNVALTTDGGYQGRRAVSAGQASLFVPVHAGMNSIRLRGVDRPITPPSPTCPCPLLLGLHVPQVKLVDGEGLRQSQSGSPSQPPKPVGS